ncbi:MAG: hypothetical protein ACRDHZ_14775, partial [Ktedonobacteraceae bacterium]
FSRGDTISAFRENIDERFFKVALHNQPDEGWQLKSDASRQLFARLMERGQPLGELVAGRMYYGIKTGLNEAFIIDSATRKRLIQADPASTHLIKPMVRGEDLRPWYQENEGRWLICLPSGWTTATFPELTTRDETPAWAKVQARYPALAAYLEPFATAGRKRQDKGQFWWELRACSYYDAFEQPKIFWADMAKYPRFSWDEQRLLCNDKGSILIPDDQSLLGILQSRITWFCISYICAPLAEREGLLIYQHKTQFIERLPIPILNAEQRVQIGGLAQQLTRVAQERYRVREETMQRVKADLGAGQRKVTDKLDEWWRLDWQGFRDEVRKSFKREIALKERNEWETFLTEQREEIERMTSEIVNLEQQLNAAVYRVFELAEDEIELVEQETKYCYGEW